MNEGAGVGAGEDEMRYERDFRWAQNCISSITTTGRIQAQAWPVLTEGCSE